MTIRQAVLLVGHGTRRQLDGGDILRRHADDLATRGPFDQVRIGFLNQDPTIAQAISEIQADRLHVVPMFLAAGLITRQRLPEALEQASPGDMELVLHPPVGSHPGLADAIARHALDMRTDPRTTLILVAHGNPKNPVSRHQAEMVADRIARGTDFHAVVTLFLEEPPYLAGWREQVPEDEPVLVLPYLIGDGYHAAQDVPRMLGEIDDRRVRLARPIGAEPMMVDLMADILQRADQT